MTVDDLVNEIKAALKKKGTYGIRGVARQFKNLDDNRNIQINLYELVNGLMDYGISLTEDEGKQILTRFDRDKSGTVDFDEFLVALRGDLNDFRRGLIKQAYGKLDVNGDGQVTLEDIAKIYDATQHPDVQARRKTPADIYREFMSQWDT
jgi:Ca2+-binding EF-hand superfamily protein